MGVNNPSAKKMRETDKKNAAANKKGPKVKAKGATKSSVKKAAKKPKTMKKA